MSFRTYRRDVSPFETVTKGRLFVVDVSINWPSNRKWQTKVPDLWKSSQLNSLRHKSVKTNSEGFGGTHDDADFWKRCKVSGKHVGEWTRGRRRRRKTNKRGEIREMY